MAHTPLGHGSRRAASGAPHHEAQSIPYHLLLDNTEDRAAFRVIHLDADAIAVPKEGGLRRAAANRLDRADFGDAGIANTAVADRFARTAVRLAVPDCPGADDHAIEQRPGLRRMGDQRREVARIG